MNAPALEPVSCHASTYMATADAMKLRTRTRLYVTTGCTPTSRNGTVVSAGRSIESEYVSVSGNG